MKKAPLTGARFLLIYKQTLNEKFTLQYSLL